MPVPDYSGRTLDDKYLLKRLLGEGGMGFVYLGEHQLIGRPVAVKFLHAIFASKRDVVKRFYREARAAAAIGHKNIIDILDVGVTDEGEPYLVMEFLEGEGLSSLLARKTRLELDTACGILEPALQALGAAHEKQIVHRDLKPDNIFLALQSKGSPEVKLIDFGISKVQNTPDQTQLTQEGSTLGTPAYMSPEQAKGAPVDHRTDLYAIGIIFYELLTGQTPFIGAQYNELLFNILTTEPRPPEEVYADFPQVAWPVIERALHKDPEERFQTADEMIQALDGLSTTQSRTTGLSNLGDQIEQSSVASGDLGTDTANSDTELAANLFSKMSRARPTQWNTVVRQATRVIKHGLVTHPKRRLYRGVVGGLVAMMFIMFSVGLCSSGDEDSVQITIKGAPKKARIYYEDSLVLANPFRVKKGETIVPLRVETPGRKQIKISIVPTKDQIVDVKAKLIKPPPKKKPAKQQTAAPKPPPPAKKKAPAATPEPRAPADDGNKTKKKATKKKKRRNPFKKFVRGVKRAFTRD